MKYIRLCRVPAAKTKEFCYNAFTSLWTCCSVSAEADFQSELSLCSEEQSNTAKKIQLEAAEASQDCVQFERQLLYVRNRMTQVHLVWHTGKVPIQLPCTLWHFGHHSLLCLVLCHCVKLMLQVDQTCIVAMTQPAITQHQKNVIFLHILPHVAT
jgi:hypothetical protein